MTSHRKMQVSLGSHISVFNCCISGCLLYVCTDGIHLSSHGVTLHASIHADIIPDSASVVVLC